MTYPTGSYNLWDLLCICGHTMRRHRLDWDDPMDGIEPDCDQCGCMEFRWNEPPDLGA